MTMIAKEAMHASVWNVYQFFQYDHLPPHLQEMSKPFCLLANDIISQCGGNGGAELTVALRKLLESKDAAVRAKLIAAQAS